MVSLLFVAWGIIQVILFFAIVVMIHEFGHFVFAKLFGVKVESFNVGFGATKLWSKKIGETEYCVRPWLAGGFVQLHGHFRPEELEALEGGSKKEDETKEGGEAPSDEKEASAPADEDADKKKGRSLTDMAYDDVHALREKPYIVKLLVFTGGVLFNFLSVILVFSALYMAGRQVPEPAPAKFDVIEASSPLYAAGARSFDEILRVGDTPVGSWGDVRSAMKKRLQSPGKEPIELTVRHEGGAKEAVALPDEDAVIGAFGLSGPFREPIVGGVWPGKPADFAGIKEGDRIVKIQGMNIESWGELVVALRPRADKQTSITLQRDSERLITTLTPAPVTIDGETRGQIGIASYTPTRTERIANPFKAARRSLDEAVGQFVFQAVTLTRIFGGGNVREIRDNVAGPVGIIAIAYAQAQRSFGELLEFFCLLSLALVLFNILPIPLLDGGHVLQATIEAVIRRPLPPTAIKLMYTVAIFFLLTFVVLIVANDVWRLGRRTLIKREQPRLVIEKPATDDAATTGGARVAPE